MTRSAALIDFENIVFDARSPTPYDPTIATHRINQVRQVTDHMLCTIAIQTTLAKRYLPLLSGGANLLFVDHVPDAADEALMATAHDYLNLGVTDLVIASGDHRFADLAPAANLHVLSIKGATSTALTMAATTTIHLNPYPTPTRKAA